jgi:diguanylate cyclase (GGDEF)-like protein/PAS domain S-box-containing protein
MPCALNAAPRPPSVLLVEDSSPDARLVLETLARAPAPGYEVRRVRLLGDAVELLERERFDVVVLDLGLPDAVGLEGLEAIRRAGPDAAVVVRTGLGDERVALAAIETGADDYIFKRGDGRDDGLERSIRYALVRRSAEDAQRRLASIVESTAVAIVSRDMNGVITSWNAGAERLYGYTAQEAIGSKLDVRILPESAEQQQGIISRVLTGERVQNYEARRKHRDGRIIDVGLTISPILDAAGRVVGASAIGRDITESKQAERDLRDAEELFRLAFDNASIGVGLVAPDTRWLRVNPALCEMLGYPAADLLGMTFHDLTHPDDLELSLEHMRGLLAGAIPRYEAEKRYVRADGSVIWVLLSVSLVREADGEPRYFVSQLQDITHRKRAETKFRGLLEAAGDAMVIADQRGQIVLANAQAERLLGYTREELLELTVEALIPGRLAGAHQGHRAEFSVDPHARPMGAGTELRALRKDGREVPVEISLGPLETEDGTLVSAAIRDVTERKLAESALREAEERFRRAFDEAPIGMAMIDLDGHFLQVNEALCTITGYTREQLAKLTSHAITHPDDVGGDELRLKTMLAGEDDHEGIEKRFIHAGGQPVWVFVHAVLLRDADGAPVNVLAQIQDVTDRRRYEERLLHQANHDALTGFLNRPAFERELDAHRARRLRYGGTGAVLVLDLDQFKFINDTLGHTAGDEAIANAAYAISSRLRETDVLARLGGDEFAVLLPNADAAGASVVAEELLRALREETVELTGRSRTLSASVGIAMFESEGELSGEDVLVNADLAMYDAKNSGRDRVEVYHPGDEQSSRMKGRVTWAQRIGHALERDDFTLLAQPIIDFATGLTSQYELLLRMNSDEHELVPPASFLYVAERLGMVQEIDRWVTRQAIGLLHERHRSGEELVLEVNLSGLSIGDPALLELIGRELDRTGVPPRNIIFEITETAAVTNMTRAGQFVRELEHMGCRFALDDFGAGYGSFYYLKHLPFDFLKIDGEFVKRCRTDKTDRLLIKAAVDIATGLGKRTIAEYVGDDETVDLLTQLGVDYGQGHHLGSPAPLSQIRRSAVGMSQSRTPS